MVKEGPRIGLHSSTFWFYSDESLAYMNNDSDVVSRVGIRVMKQGSLPEEAPVAENADWDPAEIKETNQWIPTCGSHGL